MNLQDLIEEQREDFYFGVFNLLAIGLGYELSSEEKEVIGQQIDIHLTTAITKGYELALEEVEKFVDARYQTVQATDDAHRFYQVKDKNEERTAVLDHVAHLKETK